MMSNIESLLKTNAEAIEKELETCFDAEKTGVSGLTESMRYSVLGGGKRIRAFLVNQVCQMFRGSPDASMPFACALEMVHAYSLIHDDLPCMDNDPMRRGKPSNHIAYGEPLALLAGDTLLTYAFEVMTRSAASPSSIVMAVNSLARCAGSMGMAGGQALDVAGDADTLSQLASVQKMKTGALIKAACLCGYYAATDAPDPSVLAILSAYADHLGRAFQIQDDILDVTSTPEELGKQTGIDERNQKVTILSFMTLEDAVLENIRVSRQAVEAISQLPNSEVLQDFAEWLVARKK